MDAVAVTDHGNLFGAFEFYTKAKDAGIKPILGIEAYVAPFDRTDKSPTGIRDGGFHLVLLAENNTGWKNLMKLSSDSFINGFYYKPRMDKSTLEEWGDGLIAINGHLGSSIAYHLTKLVHSGEDEHWQNAIEEAKWHAEVFAPNEKGEPRFFIELQRHGVEDQEAINPHLIKLAKELNLPLVCDNDAHFLTKDDWDAHDTLCCISMQKLKNEENRLHYPKELFVKSPEEMHSLFEDVPEAIENSQLIAQRCDVDIDTSKSHTPVVRVTYPKKKSIYKQGDLTEWYADYCAKFELHPFDSEKEKGTSEAELQQDCDTALQLLCESGLVWRYGKDGVTGAIRNRLERELKILSDKEISAYFLIVWDFVNWARQHKIPVNARGSGVGTMVGYVLGLSNACPEKYGLLFERFTDPNRSEYPDIDIDICQNGRAGVIEYVRKKYGHVAQIITFGRMKAKAAIKDVARVHGLSASEGQRLANLVPNELNITLEEALTKNEDFLKEYKSSDEIAYVIDTAKELEHHARHAGVHAAGVVVATEPLDNIVPLGKATGSSDVVTQWDGPTCETVGLLKMDFLGLRTLSTIELCKQLIAEHIDEEVMWNAVGKEMGKDDHPLDLDRIDLTDDNVLALFRRGDTAGIFQFESNGMRRLLKNMQPTRFEDLIAANALFRPGPMELMGEFCDRKNGRSQVPEVHEIVDAFTAETYGIMVYQEQVMQIVHALGDIPLRDAYTLIKAIGKKKQKVIDANRSMFIEGSVKKGLDESFANDLFELIRKFAGYGFNKSHSTGYSIIAFQTAYLKTYFPVQYMAAVLTFESEAKKTEDWAPYISDCKRALFPDHTEKEPHIGFEVGPPDINKSAPSFSIVFEEDEPLTNLHGSVRFGLGAVKGAGGVAVNAIVEERQQNGPYNSIFDFCSRLSGRVVNRATIDALIRGGAFDAVHGVEARAALIAALDNAISFGASEAEDRRVGQGGLFSSEDEENGTVDAEWKLPDVTPWTKPQVLVQEKDVLGIHVSGHPLDDHSEYLESWCSHTTPMLKEVQDGREVVIGGMIASMRITVVRNGRSAGKKMAMLSIQDKAGKIDCVIFSDAYQQYAELLQQDEVVIVVGKIDRSRGELQLLINQVMPSQDAPLYLAKRLELTFIEQEKSGLAKGQMELVSGLLKQAGASRIANGARPAEVVVHINTAGHVATLRSNQKVVVEPKLLHQIGEVIGRNNIRLVSMGSN